MIFTLNFLKTLKMTTPLQPLIKIPSKSFTLQHHHSCYAFYAGNQVSAMIFFLFASSAGHEKCGFVEDISV